MTRHGEAIQSHLLMGIGLTAGEREQETSPAEKSIDCSARTTAQRGKKRLPVPSVSTARPIEKKSVRRLSYEVTFLNCQSRTTSSGGEPSRRGRSEVPMPRETYIGDPFSQYHPDT